MTTSLQRITAASADLAATHPGPVDRDTIEIPVCPVGQLISGRGVAALLPDGRQVAVYMVDGEVHALCNIDPVARAAVMRPPRQAGRPRC